ncbi:MAG: phosphoribosylformylglycinamidine synthase subunit PurQ [Desulfovibrionaceae bacterium]|nr:phosphoribosylformylglycinamidine synthase subunit PurQ [Desulfovibrionaceae bacterium]
MVKVKTIVLTGFGTNSHLETAHTARLAGSEQVDVVHFADLVTRQVTLADYQFLIFPGGFLDGDDLGAAQAAAIRWRYLKDAYDNPLEEQLKSFILKGGLILGICNGFQLLVKLGLLPALGQTFFERQVTLGPNDSARFEDRWVMLKVDPESPCVFTKGLPNLAMPVRHGEGKIVAKSEEILQDMAAKHLIALKYADPTTGEPTQEYPQNPNGSPLACAGLTDPTGHILGLMPHPEAFHHVTNHPRWTAGALDSPPGTMLFSNAIRFLKQQ